MVWLIVDDEGKLFMRLYFCDATVGFRNMAVHNYEAINWAIVFAIATMHLQDFRKFGEAVTFYLSMR